MNTVHSSRPLHYIRTSIHWPDKRKQDVLSRNRTNSHHAPPFQLQDFSSVMTRKRHHSKQFLLQDITLLQFLKTSDRFLYSLLRHWTKDSYMMIKCKKPSSTWFLFKNKVLWRCCNTGMKNVKKYLQRLKITWFSNNIGYSVNVLFLKLYWLLIHVVSTEMSIPLVVYEMHTLFCGCRLAVEQSVIQWHCDKGQITLHISNGESDNTLHKCDKITPWKIDYRMDSNDLNFWHVLWILID
jgi:hypothetical protein